MATKSKELEVQEQTSTDLDVLSPEEEALIAANQAEVDAAEFVIPILKLAQPLTDEVTSGDAKAGDFILALTGESFSPPVEFVVAGKGKGRFKPGRKGERTLVAYDTPTVPWKDDPHYGQPFSEHPDAEEQFKARVDAKEIEWGSGPPIQTTFNYTGYIVGSDVPVRLSLRRTSAPAARKWNTLLDAVLRGRYWDQVFTVGSEQQKNDQGAYYVVTVTPSRKTSPEEKKAAIGLATALRNQAVTTVGDADDGPTVEPSANGGIEL
jgi:multidrug efflux pump subunit AcrA (membrane-fusion protein)